MNDLLSKIGFTLAVMTLVAFAIGGMLIYRHHNQITFEVHIAASPKDAQDTYSVVIEKPDTFVVTNTYINPNKIVKASSDSPFSLHLFDGKFSEAALSRLGDDKVFRAELQTTDNSVDGVVTVPVDRQSRIAFQTHEQKNNVIRFEIVQINVDRQK